MFHFHCGISIFLFLFPFYVSPALVCVHSHAWVGVLACHKIWQPMSFGDTFYPVFVFFLLLNGIKCTFPLLYHRFVLYPLVAVFLGLLCLMMQVLLMSAAGTIRARGATPRSLEVEAIALVERHVNMTSWMALSVLVMACWVYCSCRRGWHVYVLPMIDDFKRLKKGCWANTLDLRGRVAGNDVSLMG
uniref:Uncharacterized protein n=1 Tax=Trypanosoma congolense (strain IL3000) TaxID=1068625 RepID=G0UL81_TRYCI|nr:conserved hypothetical protein [Trypanosoma congolense IL3000]